MCEGGIVGETNTDHRKKICPRMFPAAGRSSAFRRRAAVLFAAVLFLLLLKPETVYAAEAVGEYAVTDVCMAMAAVQPARVRSGPAVSCPVLGMLEAGHAVNVCGRTDAGWYQIVYGNGIAYVNGKLLMEVPVDADMLTALAQQAVFVKQLMAAQTPEMQQQAAAQAQALAQQQAAQAQQQAASQAQALAQQQAASQAQALAAQQAAAAGQLPGSGNVIFVGDSRTGQMGNAVGGSAMWPGTVFVSCYGGGAEWLSSVQAKQDIDRFVTPGSVIILNYGVNDLSRHNDYISVINRYSADWRSRGASVFFASVGPVAEDNIYGKRNWAVEYFNDQLNGRLEGAVGRIDLYGYLKLAGYQTAYDGIHYTADTYARMFQFLMQSVGRG